MSFLSASDGLPEIMWKESLMKLETMINEIERANLGTLLSLTKSLSYIKKDVPATIIRKLQNKVFAYWNCTILYQKIKKVIKELPEFTVGECVKLLTYFSVLKPELSEGMISIFFDRIGNNVNKLDQKALYFLMRVMEGELTPETTIKVQDRIFHR